MKLTSISNPLAVLATLLIIAFVMFIAMTATTEANSEFQAMDTNCPFKKAEMADASNPQSIRNQVKFLDISCDPEHSKEEVVVRLIGDDKEDSKVKFESWLKSRGLVTGDQLKISFVD